MTVKGQVTIPKRVRDKLELRPGDQVEFVEEKGVVHLRRKVDMAAIQAAIEEYTGYFKGKYGTDTDALVDEMRGPRLDEVLLEVESSPSSPNEKKLAD